MIEKAKFRLAVFDWYFRESERFSFIGKPGSILACRHFGIYLSYCYQWKARYDKRRLSSLENRSTTPEKRREPTTRIILNKRIQGTKFDTGVSGSELPTHPVLMDL
jgi:hypothetical protein